MNLPNEGDSPPQDEPENLEAKDPRRPGELQKTITMAQIAKAAGVSQGAISSLLNDRDYGIRVSEKTRERVFKVCREMGYIPNDLRAVVRMYPELGDFCLLVCNRADTALAEASVTRVCAAVLAAAHAKGRGFGIAMYEENLDYAAFPDRLPHAVTSGVASKFIALGEPNTSLYNAVLKRGYPLVALGQEVPLAGVALLHADYQQAARKAIEHLAQLGHRRIAVLSSPFGCTLPRSLNLNRGVSLAFLELGLELPTQSILHGDLSFQAGVTAFEKLASSQPVPTAVFCMSDAAAAGVIAKAQAEDYRIPARLSVVGCGNDPICMTCVPALATINIPLEEMAIHAISIIEHLIGVPAGGSTKTDVHQPHLVPRQSTAALA